MMTTGSSSAQGLLLVHRGYVFVIDHDEPFANKELLGSA